MPRKTSSPPYQKGMLDAAIKSVTSGKFTTKQASTVYGVPATTIGNHLRKKGLTSKRTREPVSITQVDGIIIDWLKLMSDMGCFSLKNQLGDIVNEIFERHGQKDKLTGKQQAILWSEKFIIRHPDVSEDSVKAESISSGIAAVHIDEWSHKLSQYFLTVFNLEIEKYLVDENEGKIYTCFEVGSVFRTVDGQSSRLIYKPSQSEVEGEFLMSLYCCVSADGSFLKPVAIVKDEKVSQTSVDMSPRTFHILSSKEGVMCCEAVMLWMQLIDVETKSKRNAEPLLLFLDQGVRPLSLSTIEFCKQQTLMLFYLPGHYPNMKLPFGMDVFYNLNGEFDSILSSDDAKFGEMTVEIALNLLMEAWKLMLKSNSPITEFVDFGLVPYDLQAMKSTVEAIVPITQSPNERASEPQDAALTPGSSAHVPTPTIDSSLSIATDGSIHSPSQIATPIAHRRPKRISPKNYKEVSDIEDSAEDVLGAGKNIPGVVAATGSSSETRKSKTNLKLKIRKSDRVPNNYSIEQEYNNDDEKGKNPASRKDVFPSDAISACNDCKDAHNNGMRSGVVQGLVFALKRIESSLRADTLNLFKSRYLSPYLSDHRPTEPSFVMWCELMKCLEMGPEAVHQDFVVAKALHEKSKGQTNTLPLVNTNANSLVGNHLRSISGENSNADYISLGYPRQHERLNILASHASSRTINSSANTSHNICGPLTECALQQNEPNIHGMQRDTLPPSDAMNTINDKQGDQCNSFENRSASYQVPAHHMSLFANKERPLKREEDAHHPIQVMLPGTTSHLTHSVEDRKPALPTIPGQIPLQRPQQFEGQYFALHNSKQDGSRNIIYQDTEPSRFQQGHGRPIYLDLHEQPIQHQSNSMQAHLVQHPIKCSHQPNQGHSTSVNLNPNYQEFSQVSRAPQIIQTIAAGDKRNSPDGYRFQLQSSFMNNFTSTPKPSCSQMKPPSAGIQQYSSGKIDGITHDSSSEYHFPDANNSRYLPINSDVCSQPLAITGQRGSSHTSVGQQLGEIMPRETNQPETQNGRHMEDVRRQRIVSSYPNFLPIQQVNDMGSSSYNQITSGQYPEINNNPNHLFNHNQYHLAPQIDLNNRAHQTMGGIPHQHQQLYSSSIPGYPETNFIQPIQPVAGPSLALQGSARSTPRSSSNVDVNKASASPDMRLKTEHLTNL